MKEDKLISVLMTVYKESLSYITCAIESILFQTYKNIELIIIVDNPEYPLVEEMLLSYSMKYANLSYFVNRNNIGLALSLNRAFKKSKGEFIARMDADDISRLHRFEVEMLYLEKQDNISLIATNCSYIDKNGIEIGFSNMNNVSLTKLKKIMKYSNVIIHPTWLMRREIFENLNGYRNFPNSQDYDFALRLLDFGKEIKVINENLLQYRVHSDSISSSSTWKQYVLFKYILFLHKERLKNGIDTFSDEEVTRLVKIGESGNQKFQLGSSYLRNGVVNNNFFLILKSMLTSRDNFSQSKNVLLSKLMKMLW